MYTLNRAYSEVIILKFKGKKHNPYVYVARILTTGCRGHSYKTYIATSHIATWKFEMIIDINISTMDDIGL